MTTRRRGRPAKIAGEEVLAAAVEVCRDGDVTLLEVARRLGVTSAALYSYYGSLDQLHGAVAAELLPRIIPDATLPWDAWLRESAMRTYDLLVAYPGLLTMRRLGAAAVRFWDRVMQLMIDDAGFAARDAMQFAHLLSCYVTQAAQAAVLDKDTDWGRVAEQLAVAGDLVSEPGAALLRELEDADPRAIVASNIAWLLEQRRASLPGAAHTEVSA